MLCGQHLISLARSLSLSLFSSQGRFPPSVFVSDFPRKGQRGGYGVKNPAFPEWQPGKAEQRAFLCPHFSPCGRSRCRTACYSARISRKIHAPEPNAHYCNLLSLILHITEPTHYCTLLHQHITAHN